MRPDGEWREHVTLGPVTLDDGTRVDLRLVMRRREAGRWVYRRMTPEEVEEYLSRDGW